MKLWRYHLLATAGALIAACAMTTAPAAFAAATTEAVHDHGHAMPSKLSLDQGRKWGADAMTGKAPKLQPQPGLVQVATAEQPCTIL